MFVELLARELASQSDAAFASTMLTEKHAALRTGRGSHEIGVDNAIKA